MSTPSSLSSMLEEIDRERKLIDETHDKLNEDFDRLHAFKQQLFEQKEYFENQLKLQQIQASDQTNFDILSSGNDDIDAEHSIKETERHIHIECYDTFRYNKYWGTLNGCSSEDLDMEDGVNLTITRLDDTIQTLITFRNKVKAHMRKKLEAKLEELSTD